ncbi:rhodanese-like domain-containing protein [Nakamurella sp. PAMC28650]|uniref:rhodanese-like domain-containing protein n=1 Tax=Nakamurella sp. PAMC28650 TaxID=2762325 RepID=UPI002106EDD4|nr:rhodanese-like domain-containing protein [Nakamurella sp. PAMC28650]
MASSPTGLLRTGDGIAGALARARESLQRLTPREVLDALADGALVIDTRTYVERAEQGNLSGALVIDRTVLEWRLDPASPDRIPEADQDALIIVICRQGYSSSLAAAGLRAIGLHRATDMIGGVESWLEQRLPVTWQPADVRR